MQPEEKKYKVVGEGIDGLELGSVVLESVFNGSEVEDYLAEGRLEEYTKEDVKPYDGPMVKVKFLKDYEVINENKEKTGEIIPAGIEAEVPEPVVAYLVEDGVAEVFVEKTPDTGADVPPATETAEEEVLPVAPTSLKIKTLEGKEVVSDVMRTVNDKQYHHVRLIDGTTQDLTDEEYSLKINTEEHE